MAEISTGQLVSLMENKRQNSFFVFDEEEEGCGNTQQYSSWSSSDGKNFFPTTRPVASLPPGVYEIRNIPNRGIMFSKIALNVEGLIKFDDSAFTEVMEEISKFWASEASYKKYGLMYKRGIMLYGPPGSGKTSLVHMTMSDVISRGGIVIKFDNPHHFPDGMRALREAQPNTPVVVLMEDIESIIDYWSESDVLNILDGVNRVNKVVFMATTNYPEKLGDRVINRPSRFDKRFKIGHPNERTRETYLKHLLKVGGKKLKMDIKKWVKDTEDMSISHIKELFTSVMIIGDKYETAIETLRSMKEEKPSSNDDKIIKMGFED